MGIPGAILVVIDLSGLLLGSMAKVETATEVDLGNEPKLGMGGAALAPYYKLFTDEKYVFCIKLECLLLVRFFIES
jgi:hypothetical protein